MFYYLNRETGRRASRDTWKRSHAQGSSRYVRRISKAGQSTALTENGTSVNKPSPSEAPRSFNDYQRELQRQKKFRDFDFDFDNGAEYETGVDY